MIARMLAAMAATLLLSAMTTGAPAASADTGTACGEQLARLHDNVLSVPITGGKVDKERAGLVKLTEDATALAESGKSADAVVKLTNLQTKLDQLVAAGRISTESAALLTTDVAAATDCLATM